MIHNLRLVLIEVMMPSSDSKPMPVTIGRTRTPTVLRSQISSNHPNHAGTPLEFKIWRISLPGVAVNGNPGLKDATPPALEKSPPDPNACDEGDGVAEFPLLAGEPPGLAIALQP